MSAMLRWLTLLAVLFGCGMPAHAADVRLGERPALPVLTMLDGKTIDPARLRGKVVVLSYFSSDCPFACMKRPSCKSCIARTAASCS